MSTESILSWNFANWVTVVLMVMLGFFLLGMIGKVVQQRKAA